MKSILAVALLSYKEGIRQKLLYSTVLFAILMCFGAVLVSGLFLRDISKIILDFCLTAVNIGGLLVPFFLAIHLLSRDIERKSIVTILAQPLARHSYIIGKFLGISYLTATVMAILTVTTFISVWMGIALYGEKFFTSFALLPVLSSILLSWLGILVLNAMVVLWCTVTTSSFLATLLTFFTYIIGHSIDDVVRFLSIENSKMIIALPVRKVIEFCQYIFPNLSAFDFKNQAAHGLSIPASEFLFVTVYAIAYICIILSLAILFFRKRDIA